MVLYKILKPDEYLISESDPLALTEVFLDPNTLSADGTASLGRVQWSHDGAYMAYQIQRGGSDWAEIYVRDAKTGEDMVDDHLMWAKFSNMSWTKDNMGFFYSKYDAPASLEQKSKT